MNVHCQARLADRRGRSRCGRPAPADGSAAPRPHVHAGPPCRRCGERRLLLRGQFDANPFQLRPRAAASGRWLAARRSDAGVAEETPERLAELERYFPTSPCAIGLVMETFPIVNRKNEKAHGEHRTRHGILDTCERMQRTSATGSTPGDYAAGLLLVVWAAAPYTWPRKEGARMGHVQQPPRGDAAEASFGNLVHRKGSAALHSFHNLHLGGVEIDAVVIDSHHGHIYVVEIKDWSEDWAPADARTWVNGRSKEARTSPFVQVDNQFKAVKSTLGGVPQLLESEGDHRGKLKYSIHRVIVFTRIRRSVMEPFKTDPFHAVSLFAEDVNKDLLRHDELDQKLLAIADKRLWQRQMSDEDLAEIGRAITCSVRYDPEQRPLATHPWKDSYLDITGHAGTGKSVVLVDRCKYLLDCNPDWRVLFLCRNALMEHYLHWELLRASADLSRVRVTSFFGLAKELGYKGEMFATRGFAREVCEHVRLRGSGEYQALLIDEGQDFSEDMLRAAIAHLDRSPSANCFTVCRDPWQDIWRVTSQRTLEEVLGHTVRAVDLAAPYRSLRPIVQFARTFAYLTREGLDEDDYQVVSLYSEESERTFPRRIHERLGRVWRFLLTDVSKLPAACRTLAPVDVSTTTDVRADLPNLIRAIWDLNERARVEGEGELRRVAVVFTHKQCLGRDYDAGTLLAAILREADIKYYYIATKCPTPFVHPGFWDRVRPVLDEPSPHVLLANIWQVKGLEADAVVFVGADHDGLDDFADANGISYVGMTRGRALLRVLLQHDNQSAAAIRRAHSVFLRLSGAAGGGQGPSSPEPENPLSRLARLVGLRKKAQP